MTLMLSRLFLFYFLCSSFLFSLFFPFSIHYHDCRLESHTHWEAVPPPPGCRAEELYLCYLDVLQCCLNPVHVHPLKVKLQEWGQLPEQDWQAWSSSFSQCLMQHIKSKWNPFRPVKDGHILKPQIPQKCAAFSQWSQSPSLFLDTLL